MLMPEILSASAQTIMDTYGLYHQLTQLMEECGELIAAASHFCRDPDEFKNGLELKQEIADVIVMLDQIVVRLGISDEELAFMEEQKINRQLERIRNV